jgi:plastocyanin
MSKHEDGRRIGTVAGGAAALLAIAAMIPACGGDDSRSRREIRGPSTGGGTGGGGQAAGGGVKKIDAATAGTISGTIRWEGAKPTMEKLDVSGNPECLRVVKEEIFKEDIVVNANGTVRFAYLALDSSDTYEPPAEPAVIDQIGCTYVPHVMAVMSGQKLNIKSSDPFLHNAHYVPTSEANTEENIVFTSTGIKARTFSGPDRIKFKCDVHPWMGAWLHVPTHPFFAVSGDDGTYTIKNVPPGSHRLVLKHEKLAEQSATVTVETGKTTTQDFTLKQ